MNEQDEPHPADKSIGADWRPPRHAQMQKAWADLSPSKRERFTQLQREHGWKDEPRLARQKNLGRVEKDQRDDHCRDARTAE
jgi:hypothetical protein